MERSVPPKGAMLSIYLPVDSSSFNFFNVFLCTWIQTQYGSGSETCTLHRLYYCTTNHQKAIHYGCFSELPKGAVTRDLKVSILFKYVETGLISWALTYSFLERALHPLAISWLVISGIPRLYLLEARSSESCTESLDDFRIIWWILSWFT